METIAKLIGEIDSLLAENAYMRERLKAVESQTGPSRPNRRKLTELEVRDIRAAYRGGMSQSDLANNYGVNPATISRTVRGLYH